MTEHSGKYFQGLEGDYSKIEQRQICCYCGKSLLNNELVQDAYKVNNLVTWAKQQLKILSEMLEKNKNEWYSQEIIRIEKGLKQLEDFKEERERKKQWIKNKLQKNELNG